MFKKTKPKPKLRRYPNPNLTVKIGFTEISTCNRMNFFKMNYGHIFNMVIFFRDFTLSGKKV